MKGLNKMKSKKIQKRKYKVAKNGRCLTHCKDVKYSMLFKLLMDLNGTVDRSAGIGSSACVACPYHVKMSKFFKTVHCACHTQK